MIALTAVIAKRERDKRRLEAAIKYMLSEVDAKIKRFLDKLRKERDNGDPRAEV